MIENVLHLREIENRDWATLLFVLSFVVIATTKSAFENRFADFAKLIYSNKYSSIYKDSSNLKSAFTISLFFVQIISFSFFIHLSLTFFGYALKSDWIIYIQTITLLIFFILSKYLIEKIIATAFNIEEFTELFNLQKVTFRTYTGLLLLPVNIILFYSDYASRNVLLFLWCIVLVSNVLTYIIVIKNYQSTIFSKLFYFILYLCAFEIAPYYFMYHWFTKGID
jgi:hypothetical protein